MLHVYIAIRVFRVINQEIKFFEKMFDDENTPNKQKNGPIEITEYKQK